MNTSTIQPRRVLISVYDKEGIVDFAKGLFGLGVEIISTGGTAKTLLKAGIPVVEISNFTGFPEMMDGRVKTLHPLVHAGILGLRDKHKEQASGHDIKWIDLVVCNLYPFSKVIQKKGVSEDKAVENIDIGGPSMIRSAAKNVGWVGVVVDPNNYSSLLEELKNCHGLTYETRKKLSIQAFSHTAQYDATITNYFCKDKFPEKLLLSYEKSYNLRYGENPHQEACVYSEKGNNCCILNAEIIQGKKLSYNNINDANGALAILKEFSEPACVVVKHANPCGVAVNDSITDAFRCAYNADSLSAFGGIIALNRTCTKSIAKEIVSIFIEVVLAPNYSLAALEILTAKKNLRVLRLGKIIPRLASQELRFVDGGILLQDVDTRNVGKKELEIVTRRKPSNKEIETMLFAWKVLKHVKSNGILIAQNKVVIGIGPGQVSRIGAVDIAIQKAGDRTKNSILASDAFFPFRDSIDRIAQTGIKAIIQPGGSIRDKEVIQACNKHGLSMVFTNIRCFKH